LDIDGLYDITFRIHRFDDHRLCWVRVQGAVYVDAKKDSTRFTGTMLDITDIKQAEEKRAQLAAIIRTSNDAIISITLEGIVTSWNASAQRMFGYTDKEMICQPILKIVPEDRQDEEAHILSRLWNGLEVEHFDTKRLTKIGNLLDVSLTLSPIKDARGNTIGISKIARDITGKKQEERRKNDFVAMASHELKTPLTAITGFVQILMDHSKKVGDDFSLRVMSRIEAQAKKMGSLIQGFLSLARIEEGKIELRKEVFELDALVSEIVDDAKLLGTKHFFKLTGSEPATLYADREKIGQVLMNLVSNAIKYSPAGSTITIGSEKMAGKVIISVRDEGVGISAADQKRLFERFYRVNNDKIQNTTGFGIGLYLVSEILRYHNSNILVESEEGRGSIFYFEIDVPSR
jgi:PAS domain S-box